MKHFINHKEAVNILNENGNVAIPTETVYGLAGRIDSEIAILNIFKIKERPFFDPLIVHISEMRMLKPLVKKVSNLQQKLADSFWPGPLTLVFDKNEKKISDLISSSLPTVAVRWPKHAITEKLISSINCPIAAPSANPFKKTSPTRASDVNEYFPDLPVIDGGDCQVGIESTILNVLSDNEIEILRPGIISAQQIRDALKDDYPDLKISTSNKKNTPGSLEDHYQPKSPLYIFMNKDIDFSKIDLEKEDIKILNIGEDPILEARKLYKTLIQESKSFKALALSWNKSDNEEAWKPILDRLQKAAKIIY